MGWTRWTKDIPDWEWWDVSWDPRTPYGKVGQTSLLLFFGHTYPLKSRSVRSKYFSHLGQDRGVKSICIIPIFAAQASDFYDGFCALDIFSPKIKTLSQR